MTTDYVDYEHLIRSLNKTQRALLDRLAIGQAGSGPPATIRKLKSLGLIVGTERQELTFRWIVYCVPIHVHIAWCNVGSAEFDALSPEEHAAMEAPDGDE